MSPPLCISGRDSSAAAAAASMKTVVVRFADADAAAYYITTAGFIGVRRSFLRQRNDQELTQNVDAAAAAGTCGNQTNSPYIFSSSYYSDRKQGPVISVVKAAKDVSLVASSAEEKEVEANLQIDTSPNNKDGVLSQVEVLEIEKEVNQVAGLKKKKNSRSWSRRRSRSRDKARALSSPPEVLEITNNEIRVRSVLEVRSDEVSEGGREEADTV
ncbi:hypothetical protein DY000_02024073 [Brassica cretica]|uniref:Uncharacterized protein n=1 Tax=Brassica cretica TaxID=69181 RepID=A0ABQ7ELZ1_BRACR|nr:hypothetical protein DY000_02024073 [Brassica cretica]